MASAAAMRAMRAMGCRERRIGTNTIFFKINNDHNTNVQSASQQQSETDYPVPGRLSSAGSALGDMVDVDRSPWVVL